MICVSQNQQGRARRQEVAGSTCVRNTFHRVIYWCRDLLSLGTNWHRNTASLGQLLRDGSPGAWPLSCHGKCSMGYCICFLWSASEGQQQQLCTLTSIVGIPSKRCQQNGSLFAISFLLETLIIGPIQWPRRQKGTLASGLSLAY